MLELGNMIMINVTTQKTLHGLLQKNYTIYNVILN